MTDNRTTELREAARSIQGNLGRCLYRRKDVDEMRKVSDLLFEAADTIESIGNGTLTAEQVREAVEASTWAETSTIREFNDSSWQAIADELNVELGSWTCEWVLEHSGTLYDKWRCSKCAYLFVEPRTDQGYTDLEPNFCPNCGRKVVS